MPRAEMMVPPYTLMPLLCSRLMHILISADNVVRRVDDGVFIDGSRSGSLPVPSPEVIDAFQPDHMGQSR